MQDYQSNRQNNASSINTPFYQGEMIANTNYESS